MFVARIYGAGRAEAESAAGEIAERLGLTDRLKDCAGKLSGGLMRRLSVGMAVVTNPKLVFLDEPTLGLDIVARRELWKYIRDIQKSAAVILTTHYLEEAEALCDRVAIMARGKRNSGFCSKKYQGACALADKLGVWACASRRVVYHNADNNKEYRCGGGGGSADVRRVAFYGRRAYIRLGVFEPVRRNAYFERSRGEFS